MIKGWPAAMRAAAVAMVVFLAVGMTPVSSNLICHYCGVDDNCPQPYFFNEGVEPKVIECPQSCMKFDGVAEDGFRVTVRSCGYFDTDECAHDVDWEKGSAYGSICHCKTDNCNGAQTNGPMSLVLILGLSILAFFGVMK